jgi:hypothetical protein
MSADPRWKVCESASPIGQISEGALDGVPEQHQLSRELRVRIVNQFGGPSSSKAHFGSAGLTLAATTQGRHKSVDKKNVVLEVDGKEVAVVTGNRLKFVDADGKQLKGKGLSKQVLKEGAKVDVTTSKSDDGTETIREIHQVHGSEDDK